MNPVEFYKLGCFVQKRIDEGRRGEAVIDQLAVKGGFPKDALYKARDFSRQFTKAEAKSLKKQGLKKSHISTVLKLKDKDLQLSLLCAAAGKSWSVKKLRAKVQAISDVRPFGGRQVSSKSIGEVVHELRLLCKRTVAYVDQLEDHDFWRMPEETIAKIRSLKALAQWTFEKILD